MEIYKAISAVMADIAKEGIAKDRKNEQQGYRFRGIDDVYNALSPILAKHGVVVLPRILSRDVSERQTIKGGALFNVVVEAEFDLISAKDGSKHVIRTYGEAMDSADKATNKAMSAAYKYAAMQAFCIPTEGDHDSENQTHDVAPRDARPPAPDWKQIANDLTLKGKAIRDVEELTAFWNTPEFKAFRRDAPPERASAVIAILKDHGEALKKAAAEQNKEQA